MRAEIELAREAALRRCRSAGASAEEAEDSVHDALLALLETPHVDRPAAWVTTVSHRRWIDHVRRNSRERVVLRRELELAGHDPGPADLVTDREQAKWLVTSLRTLPETTRLICWSIGLGRSREQVAGDFGLTPRAVESHLTRARRSLRRLRALAVLPMTTTLDWLSRHRPTGIAGAAMVPVTLGLFLLPPQTTAPLPAPLRVAPAIVAPPSHSQQRPLPHPVTPTLASPASTITPTASPPESRTVRPQLPATTTPPVPEVPSTSAPTPAVLPIPDVGEALNPLLTGLPGLPLLGSQ